MYSYIYIYTSMLLAAGEHGHERLRGARVRKLGRELSDDEGDKRRGAGREGARSVPVKGQV